MVTPEALLQKNVQQFIRDHEQADIRQIALQQKEIDGVPSTALAIQIAGRQKAKVKLSLYYHTKDIIYPASLNIEQSSSQATALFKANLIKSLFEDAPPIAADLTGGFGVDCFFIGAHCKSITHIEPNTELQKIAQHNHQQLRAATISYANATAEVFLDTTQQMFHLLFIDPSRRKDAQRVHGLADCEPAVIALQKKLFEKTEYLLIKTSPLLDIHSVIKDITCVKCVFVVAVDNECKEVLYLCKKGFTGLPLIEAVDLSPEGEPKNSFPFSFEQESSASVEYSDPLAYLYEPNAAILKAGAFKSIAYDYDLSKIHKSTHLYTSSEIVADFPGRIFKIEHLVKADSKDIHALLPDQKANVITRNYPLSPEQLKVKLKIKDGGDRYLIAFSGERKKMIALCSRL